MAMTREEIELSKKLLSVQGELLELREAFEKISAEFEKYKISRAVPHVEFQ